MRRKKGCTRGEDDIDALGPRHARSWRLDVLLFFVPLCSLSSRSPPRLSLPPFHPDSLQELSR